jgi:hypothetical protein
VRWEESVVEEELRRRKQVSYEEEDTCALGRFAKVSKECQKRPRNRPERDLLRSKRDLMPAALAGSPDIGS